MPAISPTTAQIPSIGTTPTPRVSDIKQPFISVMIVLPCSGIRYVNTSGTRLRYVSDGLIKGSPSKRSIRTARISWLPKAFPVQVISLTDGYPSRIHGRKEKDCIASWHIRSSPTNSHRRSQAQIPVYSARIMEIIMFHIIRDNHSNEKLHHRISL